MPYYYEPIWHENSTDKEEEIASLYSSKEEPKHIDSIILIGWNNEGILAIYREREKLGEIPTGASNIQLPAEIPIDLDLPEGQTFRLTLKNRVTGTNAKLIGYIKYQLK